MTEIETEKVNKARHDSPAAREGLSGSTLLLAIVFQAMFEIDLDFEAAMREAEGQPAPAAGRPARSGGGLVSRRMTNPLARLYMSTSMAEVAFLPLCRANSPQERDQLNREIGCILALDRALAAGLITGWTVCWPPGRFPKRPSSVRLRTTGGKGARERCLGELAPQLREDLEEMKHRRGQP